MPRYLFHDRMRCEVTFVRRIEAKNESAAYDIAYEGGGELLGVVVGDQVADAPHNIPKGVFYPEPVAPRKFPENDVTADSVYCAIYDHFENAGDGIEDKHGQMQGFTLVEVTVNEDDKVISHLELMVEGAAFKVERVE